MCCAKRKSRTRATRAGIEFNKQYDGGEHSLRCLITLYIIYTHLAPRTSRRMQWVNVRVRVRRSPLTNQCMHFVHAARARACLNGMCWLRESSTQCVRSSLRIRRGRCDDCRTTATACTRLVSRVASQVQTRHDGAVNDKCSALCTADGNYDTYAYTVVNCN